MFKIVTLIQGVAFHRARAPRQRCGAVRPDRRRRRRPDDDGLRRLGSDASGRREALVGSGGGAERRMLGIVVELPGVRGTRPGVCGDTGRADAPGRREALVGRDARGRRVARCPQNAAQICSSQSGASGEKYVTPRPPRPPPRGGATCASTYARSRASHATLLSYWWLT